MINYLSDLLRNKRFERNVISNLNFLESRIQNLNERIRELESTVVSQANTITSLTKNSASGPWQISKKGNVALENAVVRSAPISSGIITNGKVSSKEAKTSGDTGLRANFGSGRADSSRFSAGADSTQPQYDPYAGYEGSTFSGSVSSRHNHNHHEHDCGDTGGYDSGCSDSSSGSFD
ncbi:hypothetical protein AM337_005768 [Klebsiella pneumoniae]|nr:hypothetical protein AM337_005768 [Klebsiella pneumoniae]